MQKISKFVNKLSNLKRIACLIILGFVLLSAGIRYINNGTIFEDINVASNYREGEGTPVANININTHSWNTLSFVLNTVRFDSSFTFTIEDIVDSTTLDEIYYYISNSNVPLTQEEIDQISSWNLYTSGVSISQEGFYVVYVKTVDSADNVSYLNTDSLVVDMSGSSVNANLDDSNWSSLRDTLDYMYIDRSKTIAVVASDDLSGISSIKYYITDQILNTTELDALNSSDWTTYSDGILINDIGTSIAYIQVIDNCNHITYINSDYIVFDGYTEDSIVIGRDSSSYLNADNYITNKSIVTFNINYTNSSTNELVNYTHNLISNILLPLGTKITLIDHITEKVYEYQIATVEDIYGYNDSCDIEDLDCIKVATYPFTLFKEVGTATTNIPFVESTYYDNGTVSEDFTIVLDFFNTNITDNYDNVTLYTELHDNIDGINVRPTLYDSIKKYNIYSNVSSENTNASLSLTTDYSGNMIEFNSDSSTDINITSKLNYKYKDTFRITDTTYENKEMGLLVKLVDSNGNIVSREHLRNIIFKVGNSLYYPESDNMVHIKLNSGITDVTKTLTIITYQNNDDLEKGTYYFKISNYASYDGYYDSVLGTTELSISVNVSDDNSVEHSFDVIMNDSNRIINKTDNTVNVMFNILENAVLENPSIRISLYKKDQLTAYDQNYSIVDLSNYVSDSLNKYMDNVYYVSTNPIQYGEPEWLYNNFELNLIPANFENTGYKYVFSLYDGIKKIGTIEKYFIVK